MARQSAKRQTTSRLASFVVLSVAVLGSPVQAQDDGAAGFKFLEVKVLDPDGHPATNVDVEIDLDGMRFPMPTDDQGMVSLNVPAGGETRLEVKVQHDGYAAVGASWRKGATIPDEFTIPLAKGVAIGGIVHDEQGQPITGVIVEGAIPQVPPGDALTAGQARLKPMLQGVLGTTDSEGRWQNNSAPERPLRLALRFSHDDYVKDRGYGYRGGTWEELRSLDHVVVLEQGIEISGRVLDPDGSPVAGAKVAVGRSRFVSDRQIVETNDRGEYRLRKLKPGPTVLTVSSSDFAPDLRVVRAKRDGEPVDFRLLPPQTVRLRVVDPAGQPVAGVTIIPEEWRSYRALEDPFDRAKTNADGIWEWKSAPADEIQYSIFKPGRFGVPDWQARFAAGEEIQDVTMLPAPVVTGRVVDKQTGLPIDQFRYVEGVWWEPSYTRYVLQSSNVQVGKDGVFRFVMQSGCEKFMIRVETDGYRSANSRDIFPHEGEVTIDFELEEGSGPRGIVSLPDGTPAVGAEIAMATAEQQAQIYNGVLEDHGRMTKIMTDDEGRFELPFAEGLFAVVCIHDVGWAVAEGEASDQDVQLTLQPWAQVVGTVQLAETLVADEAVSLYFPSPSRPGGPRVYWSYHDQTDVEGEFAFDRVKSGLATINRRVRYATVGDSWMSANSHTAAIDVRPGETIRVEVGGTGRRVTGKLTIPAGHENRVAWRMGAVTLQEAPAGDNKPETKQAAATPTSKTHRRSYASALAEDGRFLIDDVPAGTYRLTVRLLSLTEEGQRSWDPVASLDQIVTVAAAESEDNEPYDIGQHELEMAASAPPSPGE